jgi:hypothetical protein
MWQLKTELNGKRTYINSVTGSQCTQTMVYVDKEGNKWWGFDNLMELPFTRSFAATKISSLYTLGLTTEDFKNFFTKHKATLKAKDNGEKYERAYAETLDFESKIEAASDPVKQQSALVTVYFTLNDEPIDSFGNEIQMRKMSILESDLEAHSFFLQRQIYLIESYTHRYNLLSQIASVNQSEQ